MGEGVVVTDAMTLEHDDRPGSVAFRIRRIGRIDNRFHLRGVWTAPHSAIGFRSLLHSAWAGIFSATSIDLPASENGELVRAVPVFSESMNSRCVARESHLTRPPVRRSGQVKSGARPGSAS